MIMSATDVNTRKCIEIHISDFGFASQLWNGLDVTEIRLQLEEGKE